MILKNAGVSDADLAHCLKVADKAVEMAQRTGVRLDLELVGRGAFFHDLGKAKSHDMDHGKIGADLGIALGLPKYHKNQVTYERYLGYHREIQSLIAMNV